MNNFNKRRLASHEGTLFDLNNEIPRLFIVMQKAFKLTEEAISDYPIGIRSRNHEASLMQSIYGKLLAEEYGEKVSMSISKRLVLQLNNYVLLFKKLNRRMMPMNHTSQAVMDLMQQSILINGLSCLDKHSDPILILGYQKNRLGQYTNPCLVYIDEGVVKFVIDSDTIEGRLLFPIDNSSGNIELKPGSSIRRAN